LAVTAAKKEKHDRMPGLNIFTSNQLEILAVQLAQQLKTPVTETLKPDIIVIQSSGMERWISQALARHNGICANVQFPFPNTFLDHIAQQVLPDDAAPWTLDPDVLMFKIMKALPTYKKRTGFERLRSYLTDDAARLKELQMADKLADLYDQYQVFRPEMIIRWEAGENPENAEDHWQAELWRLLQNGEPYQHRAGRQRNLIEHLQTHPALFPDLPQRIFMFGISYLPRFHLETFAALSEIVETNVYLLNPCQEYWGDIVSQKQMQRIQRSHVHSDKAVTDLHLEEGNRLLASMGSQGKDFHTGISSFDFQFSENYQDPGCVTLLNCIQSDILNLRDRRPVPSGPDAQNDSMTTTIPAPRLKIDPSDSSIQIHCCHSPMRETEVLHDHLLAMFEADPRLRPNDIVVMTPDIDIYAPYIQAVFDTVLDERLNIPFCIADRGVREQSRLIDGFLSFLELKGSRFSVSRVLRLLETPGVREKFGLNRSDIEVVERWIRDTRIRWGIDADHRRELDLPALIDNTWYAGIRRMLLGYAMPGNQQRMFDDILPYDAIEGNDIQSLGKFLNFSDAVFQYARGLSRAKSLGTWSTYFKRLLNDFFQADEETQRELKSVRSILDNLAKRQTDAAFTDKLEFEPIRFYLERQLDKLQFSSGFMTGGVTFCAMLPMRSIPFKIVCLMGMNSDAFPRDSQSLSFDQIAQHPKPGDRSRRNDDKYLFLESIISARNTLYISYVGQSIQDNSHMPPSPLVSELLDTIELGFELPGQKIREHVLRYHRLQAFASEYFTPEGPLFSYSAENRDAAAFINTNNPALPLIIGAIPLTTSEKAEWRNLDIESLCRFFSHPTRFMLQQRLGIYLEQTNVLTAKREDFKLEPLDKFHVGQHLLKARLAGFDLDTCRSAQLAAGHFPHGNVGTLMVNEMSSEVETFASRVETLQQKRIAEPAEVYIDVDEFNLRVRMPQIHKSGLVQYRYANQRAQDLLGLWIYHLVLCDRAQPGLPQKSVMLFKDSVWQFEPVNRPRLILAELIRAFMMGLEKPLHFFPATSFVFVFQQQANHRSEKAAMTAARHNWSGSDYFRGESDDPYIDICFKGIDPLDSHFTEVSHAVFGHLLANGGPVERAPLL
jgi:exodeoxyribonuclease V gamma subunit